MKILKTYLFEIFLLTGVVIGIVVLFHSHRINVTLGRVLMESESSVQQILKDQALLQKNPNQINIQEWINGVAKQFIIQDQLSVDKSNINQDIAEYRFNQISMQTAEEIIKCLAQQEGLPILSFDIIRSKNEGYVRLQMRFQINKAPQKYLWVDFGKGKSPRV
ncbi:MAG: hypothetical protein Q8Q33_05745 [Chlamydiota bacterium]|nr:hypothetical protein [Chlamydiota bacterium]